MGGDGGQALPGGVGFEWRSARETVLSSISELRCVWFIESFGSKVAWSKAPNNLAWLLL